VVAFLPKGDDTRDQQVADLGALAGNWHILGVRVFWLEIGQNEKCEGELDVSYNKPSVIAFRSDNDTFEHMQYSFNIDNMQTFVD